MDRRRSLLKQEHGNSYERQYLTIEILDDNTSLGFYIPSEVDENYVTSISYSIDNGATWTTVLNDDTEQGATLQLNTGDKVLWKGIARSFAADYTDVNKCSTFVSIGLNNNSNGRVKLSGNIMSLLYGDNFYSQKTLEQSETFCYLFSGDSLFTVVDAENLILPATTLTEGCYSNMFKGCTALEIAPKLSATTLATACYYGMFEGCTSLETAPELPAPVLSNLSYEQMFYGCSSLNYISVKTTSFATEETTNYWVQDVASSGTFLCPDASIWQIDSVSGIPVGWTVITVKEIEPTLTFTPAGYVTVSSNGVNKVGLKKLCTYQTMYISADHEHWEQMTTGQLYTNIGNIYLCGMLIDNATNSDYTNFTFEGTNTSLSGNCNTLWNYENLNAPLKEYCGYHLFTENKLISTKNLLLPATTLAPYCYAYMFQNCTSLTEAPELPATTLATACYSYMFGGCKSLTTAPELPATTLDNNCYASMFANTDLLPDCSNIDFTSPTVVASGGLKSLFRDTKVTDSDLAEILPKNADNEYCLPVTTLVTSCYTSMFQGCAYLQTAPTLPATTLVSTCYFLMFYGCSNLNKIKMLATDISAGNCLSVWVQGVAKTGLFVKSPSMTSLSIGNNGIPSGWGVQDIGSSTITYNFAYKSSPYNLTLPAGTYTIECWGAQGGSINSTYYGGKGGYSVGDLTLDSATNIFVYVGGKGTGDTTTGAKAGGFNGGGKGYSTSSTYIECGGGGASDVRIGTDSLLARVIVAGGGGGAGSYNSSTGRYVGGAGGGKTGGTGGQYSTSYRGGTGGSQTARGTSYYGTTSNSTTYGTLADFGIGAGAGSSTSYQITGGGGGWYGGGYSRRGGGGGGSGYVYTANTASNYPSGCLLNSDYYLDNTETDGGTVSFPAVNGGYKTGHEGNGYVRITLIDIV